MIIDRYKLALSNYISFMNLEIRRKRRLRDFNADLLMKKLRILVDTFFDLKKCFENPRKDIIYMKLKFRVDQSVRFDI